MTSKPSATETPQENAAQGSTADQNAYADCQVLDRPKEGVIRVGARPVIVQCLVFYHGSDMGFSKSAWSIRSIYDQKGNSVKPVFESSWQEIAPGIATHNPGINQRWSSGQRICRQAIRISLEACPVKVVFEEVNEYNDYDDYRACSWSTKTVTMLFERQS